MILSIDLASRRYRDNGIALLSAVGSRTRTEIVSPESLGLVGEPDSVAFARALCALAESREVRLLILDGPQGWRADASTLVHARACERETLTPGKTGLPGQVKPRSWTRMAEFSIALFDALEVSGWPRLTSRWAGERVAVESFPTHAWRVLGHPPLPGKGRRADVSPWRERLEREFLSHRIDDASHDDVQAIVAGLAGRQMLEGGLGACDVRGREPSHESGHWREGFIVCPRATLTA